jgi:hypothetical protein
MLFTVVRNTLATHYEARGVTTTTSIPRTPYGNQEVVVGREWAKGGSFAAHGPPTFPGE